MLWQCGVRLEAQCVVWVLLLLFGEAKLMAQQLPVMHLLESATSLNNTINSRMQLQWGVGPTGIGSVHCCIPAHYDRMSPVPPVGIVRGGGKTGRCPFGSISRAGILFLLYPSLSPSFLSCSLFENCWMWMYLHHPFTLFTNSQSPYTSGKFFMGNPPWGNHKTKTPRHTKPIQSNWWSVSPAKTCTLLPLSFCYYASVS